MPHQKTVLVTRGYQGIGFTIVKKFSQEGFEVVNFDLQSPPSTSNAKFFKVDVRKEYQVKKAITQIASLDTVVSNAGIYLLSSVGEMTIKDLIQYLRQI